MLSDQLRSAVVVWIVTALIFSTAQAQAERPSQPSAAGILTDRLSAKQVETWRKIERIVFALDAEGQILHPALHDLWRRLETSGHTIYIEVSESQNTSSYTAGVFRLERFDPAGRHHIAVIRLHLGVIDRACVGPQAKRPGGFIPFEGLGKIDRYAEVLGHELAHAADILLNLERARLVEEVIEQTRELVLSSRRRRDATFLIGAEINQRINNRDSLLQALETYSEMMEARVWRELRSGQQTRK